MGRLIHVHLFVLITDLTQITTILTSTHTLLLSITKGRTFWCSFVQMFALGVA